LFQTGCNYAKLSGEAVPELANADTPYVEVGLQAYRIPNYDVITDEFDVVYSGECIEYPASINIDGTWKAAKGFQFAALVLGGGATFYLWISTCCRFSRGSWRWAGYEVLLASIFQALSFIWFRTEMCQENECELFYGSKADIIAAVFWFVSALGIFCYYPTPREISDDADGLMAPEDSGTISQPTIELQTGGADVSEPMVTSAVGLPAVTGHEKMSPGQDSRQDGKNKDFTGATLA
jgi:hypothetical protein